MSVPRYLDPHSENIALMFASHSQDSQWFTGLRMRLKHCLDKAFTKRGKFKSVLRIPRLISKLKRNVADMAFFILFGGYRIQEACIYCQLAAR